MDATLQQQSFKAVSDWPLASAAHGLAVLFPTPTLSAARCEPLHLCTWQSQHTHQFHFKLPSLLHRIHLLAEQRHSQLWNTSSYCGVRDSRSNPIKDSVLIMTSNVTYTAAGMGHTLMAVPRLTPPSILHGMVKWISAFWLDTNNKWQQWMWMISAYWWTQSKLDSLVSWSSATCRWAHIHQMNWVNFCNGYGHQDSTKNTETGNTIITTKEGALADPDLPGKWPLQQTVLLSMTVSYQVDFWSWHLRFLYYSSRAALCCSPQTLVKHWTAHISFPWSKSRHVRLIMQLINQYIQLIKKLETYWYNISSSASRAFSVRIWSSIT